MTSADGEGCRLARGVRLVFCTKGPQHHFFGFYGIPPLDFAGRRLLCLAVNADIDSRLVEEGDEAEVGYWDICTGEYTGLAVTRAFNWQQGAMLQWMPPDYSTRIVYNDRIEDRFRAVVLDVESGKRKVLSHTIYALAPDGKVALTPVFERLVFPRPSYSYAGVKDERWNAKVPAGDGVYLLDLENDTSRMVVATEEIRARDPHPSMATGVHYIEQLVFSPDGRRFAFYHRWTLPDGGGGTRLYTVGHNGEQLHRFPDGGMYSHGCWRSDEELLFWGRPPGLFSKIRYRGGVLGALLTPVLRARRAYLRRYGGRVDKRSVTPDSYLLMRDLSHDGTPVGPDKLRVDGHPSFCPSDRDWFVTDTYEDAACRRHLLLYNMEESRLLEVGSFWSPRSHNSTGYRCDLHPRWDHSGRRVCIDSMHDGTRQMYVLDVESVLE